MFFVAALSLRTVCNELGGVKHKAFEIGVQLGVAHGKLMEWKKKDNLLSTVVDHWLNGNSPDVPCSWKSLVEVLECEYVGEPGCAKRIHAKYCCNQEQPEDESSTYSITS